ncbi:MAG TPA: asparagine synthase (glutamine-hydrolyzing), partial [Casimicrobiaceae bacterium]
MCGIAGYINLDGRPLAPDADEPVLAGMGDALHHRGPDDTRVLLWENVGFIFKRLSIVDLEGGAQPLHAADGRISAMVNGEIYNHRAIRADLAHRHSFGTASDCEVIPYLYLERDLDLLAPVNGMFAVALLDRQKRRVLLARDHTGIKPLFYCIADNGRVLVFASELKGLFAHPAVPRVFDWHSALVDPPARDARTVEYTSGFKGIERVPAATVVDIDLHAGRVKSRRYWTLPARDPSPAQAKAKASDYVDGYRALLADSVTLRLMSDVGYGVFLSGGVDSSVVAAIAARAGPFPTFSIRSQSTQGSGDARGAREVADVLGLPNHQVLFDEATLAVDPDHWRRVLWACELYSLTAEQLFKFNLHAFARRHYPNLKVMLLGQGSDEFNGGYISAVLQREGPWNAGDWKSMGERLRHMHAAHAAATAGVSEGYLDLFASGALARDFAVDAHRVPDADTVWDLYVAHFRKNLDYHLWHEDRTAAWHSIENRVP